MQRLCDDSASEVILAGISSPTVTYQCVRGAASQCSTTCGTGITTNTATCTAYSNGQQTAVLNYETNPTAQQQCGNCVSTTAPCLRPASVTYSCVVKLRSGCTATCGDAGVQTTTRACMSYAGGGTAGADIGMSMGHCPNCVPESKIPCPPLAPCPTGSSNPCVCLFARGAHAHACMHIHTYVRRNAFSRAQSPARTHARTPAGTQGCTHTRMHARMHGHMHAPVRLYTCRHTHASPYTCARAWCSVCTCAPVACMYVCMYVLQEKRILIITIV